MEEKVANPQAHNLRFCVALELNKGWVDKLLITSLDGFNAEVLSTMTKTHLSSTLGEKEF